MKNKRMKRIYSNKAALLLAFIANLCTGLPGQAQTADRQPASGHCGNCKNDYKKAWEIGIGATGLQLTRFNIINFQTNSKGGYTIDANKRDLLFGGHLYVARELTPHFYLDLQGMLDYSSDPVRNGHESRWVGMAGLGLQWRLGEYFHSPYIDPFLRAGVNYMYKNFTLAYNGLEEFNREEMGWNLSNDFNKEGRDKRHLIPLSLGAGVNMWLNSRVGIGLEADYLFMPYRQVANAWQGTVRLMWRIGGKPKQGKATVQYVEKVVEKIVEKPVIVEKRVEVPAQEQRLCDLFNTIYFDFDKADITERAETVIDEIAQIMKAHEDKKYLITGCTDAKGSPQYNLKLAERRANAVLNALVEKGVPAGRLKARGVGKKISYASPSASNKIREGDRKIMVEIITNMAYWNHIP